MTNWSPPKASRYYSMGSVQVIPVLKINFSPPTAESRIRKNVDLDLFYLLLSFTDAPTPPSIQNVQGVFFYWSVDWCGITCKCLQKSSKCQNFLRVWHKVIFRADQ